MTAEGEGSSALCPRRSPQVALSRKGCQDHAPLAAPATCAVLPLEEKVVTEGVAVGGAGSLVVAQRTFSSGEQNSPARQSPRAGCAAGALWPDPAFCWRREAGGSPSNPFRPATVCCHTSSPCLHAPASTEGRHLGLQHDDRASAPLTPCPGNGHDRPPGLHIPPSAEGVSLSCLSSCRRPSYTEEHCSPFGQKMCSSLGLPNAFPIWGGLALLSPPLSWTATRS